MARRPQVAVVGAGAMGASAAWHLGRRGHDVTVFEQFAVGHGRGSSHGDARIFRLAHTDPWWTALARTAAGAWDGLQEASGRRLVDRVGGLDHGDPDLVGEVAASCARAGVVHERLDPAAARERWPGLRLDRTAVFHPSAGTTDAAATVRALLDLAVADGAELVDHAPVSLAVVDGGVEVRRRGDRARRFEQVVVAAGAWTAEVLAGLVALPELRVTREHPVEFRSAEPDGSMPWPTMIHHDTGMTTTSGIDETIRAYALPTPGGRVKVGEHHRGPITDPRRAVEPDPAAVARVRRYVDAWLPGLDPDSAAGDTCLYTTTPTTDFVLDRVGPFTVAAGFSGHGFKYVPWVGGVLADLVAGGSGPERFRLPAT